MKYIYLSSLIIVMSAFLFMGCDNADYKAQGNSLYIADAAGTAKATTITMDGGADINVTVRLAQKLGEDVEVEIGFTPEILTGYNANNGTEYEALPAEHLPQGATVTIPAGEISATFQLHIDDFTTNGITYAVPLTLGNVIKGNVTKSAAQGRFIYVLSKPLNVSVPVMKPVGSDKAETDPDNDWGAAVETYTLEAWVRMSYLSRNNQAIFNVRANNELYIRFGDIRSVERRYKGTGFDKMKLADNVSAGDFICGGSQGNNRHLRELLMKYPHLSVLRSKIVSPLRNTMRFINSEQGNMHISQ